MSAWRFTLKQLHELGGRATYAEIAERTVDDPRSALRQARVLGLVDHDPFTSACSIEERRIGATWWLTDRGRQWCDGAITDARLRQPGQRIGRPRLAFTATWLAPLLQAAGPLTPRTCPCCQPL
jgi:hypothetical protein